MKCSCVWTEYGERYFWSSHKNTGNSVVSGRVTTSCGNVKLTLPEPTPKKSERWQQPYVPEFE